ncbi:MAG TPA: putative LPS assembly protein LptD, partial [Chitinophagales bacterium]|nr:putative LPS assembly protein LptD [Chitinophagales bacterium]
SQGSLDSSGQLQGNPIFEDDGKEYKAKKMKYNFKTKKGIVFEVLTKEGDAYIHANVVKKNEFDEWYGQSARYTTCDQEDHPHFYFKAKRVKVVPGKVMVSGTANLWVADVPTPLVLPFGIFPVKQGKRSGIVLPEYGQDAVMGFFLRNGGYYWAVNDYLGLKFTTQISTNGTVGAGLNAQYAWKYKFNGSLAFNYLRARPFDPDLPNAKATNSYSLSWSHTQDPRSMPNSSFGASVQMQSADFYQTSRVTDQRLLNTSFNSNVNFGHTFVGTPFSISANVSHQQNLLNRTISFGLPTLRLSMSRVSPFKAKVQTGQPKWYENIGFTYSLEFQNRISTYDSTLFYAETADKFRFGVNQNFSIDAPLRLFKYLNITPSFQYQERTYFKGQTKSWDPDTVYVVRGDGRVDTLNGQIKTDTIWKFNSARNFSANISFGTKVIGIYKFKNKYIKALKHVFTPSVGFNYSPDFGSDFWKYNRYVQGNANGDLVKYSVFEPDAVYGVPGYGQVAQLNWSLNNNFEMKTYSKKDTVNHEQKVGLLDQVNLSGGYNFIADSLRLQPFNLSIVAARIFNLINLNFSAQFDPYAVDSQNRKINTYQWDKNRRLLRFATANISASMSLHSKQRTNNPMADEAPPRFMGDYVSYNPNQIYNFDIPWNLSLAYNFNISKGTYFNPDTVLTVQSIHAQVDFNLTPHWKVAVSTGFDISRKQITLTNVSVIRDLHCWELTFAWTPPLPTFPRQQFSIILHPKSGTLKDLKLQKKNSQTDL